MRHFDEIMAMAADRHGGARALRQALRETRPLTQDGISAISDARILAAMTRRVFSAGFSAKVVDAKWEAFERAFDRFDPVRCVQMSDERIDELLKGKEVVRNGAKILSVRVNACFVLELAEEHGGAGRFFAKWPDREYVGLLQALKARASRLGGETGMRFLRSIGKAAFIPTPEVVKALVREGVLSKSPSGKGDFALMQVAFNQWSTESGMDLTSISRTLAMSVG